ncbi:MAG: SpoIID/LytB domain-containing protein [Bacillota bacterium]
MNKNKYNIFHMVLVLLILCLGSSRGLERVRVDIGLVIQRSRYINFNVLAESRIFRINHRVLGDRSAMSGSYYQVQMHSGDAWEESIRALQAWKKKFEQAAALQLPPNLCALYTLYLAKEKQYVLCAGKYIQWDQAEQAQKQLKRYWPAENFKVIHIREEEERVPDFMLHAGEAWQAVLDADRGEIILCQANGRRLTSPVALGVTPVDDAGENASFELGAQYSGELVLRFSFFPEEITPVNRLDLEVYLQGVLAGEVFQDWPPETIKAQAVAARSYALAQTGKHLADGFDLCDSTDCQSYQGVQNAPLFRKAVRETEGEVIAYERKIIAALYHSSGGGRTENIEDIWPGTNPRPYYRSVPDFDYGTKGYRWESPVIIRTEDALGELGWPGADRVIMEILPAPGCRYPNIRFYNEASGEEKVYTRQSLRRLFNLPSPKFTVVYCPSRESLDRILRFTPSLDAERLSGIFFPAYLRVDSSAYMGGIASPRSVRLAQGAFLYFNGYGKGHGVGLSQWGSYVLGSQGMGYKQILKYYYSREIEVLSGYGRGK